MTKKFKITSYGNVIGEIKGDIYDDIHAIELCDYEIYPKYQNKGYGSKALKKFIDQLKNQYDLVYCFVDKDNERAIHVYEKFGKKKDVGNQYQFVFWDKKGEYLYDH